MARSTRWPGPHAAARALRENAGFIRQYINAAELASEIRQPRRVNAFHRAAIGPLPAIHTV